MTVGCELMVIREELPSPVGGRFFYENVSVFGLINGETFPILTILKFFPRLLMANFFEIYSFIVCELIS